MRRILLVALVAAACQHTKKEPTESRIDVRLSPDYEKVRPVTIALLPLKAPRVDIQTNVRQEVYRLLPERRYSPFKLSEVDSHIGADGKFAADDLDWDATLEIVFDEYAPSSGNYWITTGRAVMMHRTGEELWACHFEDYKILVPSRTGTAEHGEAAREMAYFLVGGESGESRLPDCPPPPPGP